ncbi:MAG: hypothetical protein IJN70_06825 [Clostridia bacterium]|nr:hypothetical protein [Clostridia bacterium]
MYTAKTPAVIIRQTGIFLIFPKLCESALIPVFMRNDTWMKEQSTHTPVRMSSSLSNIPNFAMTVSVYSGKI